MDSLDTETALRAILDYVERHNKQDEDRLIATAAHRVQSWLEEAVGVVI
jgi:hypothetical protein